MAEATGEPAAAPQAPSPEPSPVHVPEVPSELSLRGLLEVGAHFGHQTRRWDPRMKRFIFGQRNGIHIMNLDYTVARFGTALDFLRETVAAGGKVLFVATKRQAQGAIQSDAERSGQYYVNNRWLGGMLTNFRTVRRSIERFKEHLAVLADEEKVAELSKKELSRLNRAVTKYQKSLDGIKEMQKLPDAMFVIDINREHIALAEAKRLSIPVVAVVDTNCNPGGIEHVIPGNDDAIRAIHYYCKLVANACLEGAELFNERVQSQASEDAAARSEGAAGGRRVVEIKQPPRGRRGPGGTHSQDARARRPRPGDQAPAPEAAPAPAAAAPPAAAPEAPAAAPAAPSEAAANEGESKG